MDRSQKGTLGHEDGAREARGRAAAIALRETLHYGEVAGASLTGALPAASGAGRARSFDEVVNALELDATAAAPVGGTAPARALAATLGSTRTTVLPRRKRGDAAEAGPSFHVDARPRFERVELLGKGGMGEVALEKDNDIHRTVAVKRLLAENRSDQAVLRFADEVRAVGQLEHPGIVPVYDVGVDEGGQHYLVMKHVQGETLEAVIEKLAQGDPAYAERFTHSYRAHVFLEILQAIRYAHDRGFIHRDIKPANIMIGPFGEVTVMDWGLAKKIDRAAAAEPLEGAAAEPKAQASGAGRLLETVHGALLGTPLYMSPEQAAGRNDALDERSDVFSLSVLFYELLTLRHPLDEAKSIHEVLAALTSKDLPFGDLAKKGLEAGAPVEHLQLLEKGFAFDRERRFASVGEMEQGLRAVLSGKMAVKCHISLTKRAGHGFLRWIDRHPFAYTALLGVFVVSVLGGIVFFAARLVKGILA